MTIYSDLSKYLGFSEKWINWVMECITTATFSVLVNGIPGKFVETIQRNKARGPYISLYFYYLRRIFGKIYPL